MGVLSLLLAVLAGFLTLLGFLTAIIPVVGAVLAFSAPVAALAGVWVGGVSWSKARAARRAVELPVVAVVLNVMAFVPALLVALTCGVCNTLAAKNGTFQVQRQFGTFVGAYSSDGGLGVGFPPEPGMRTRLPEDEADAGVGAGGLMPPPLPAGPRAAPPDLAVPAQPPAK